MLRIVPVAALSGRRPTASRAGGSANAWPRTTDMRNRSDQRRRQEPSARGRRCPICCRLPALLVCIGILVPFVTAVCYSLQRYN